jgi:hypothetical protein
MYMRFFVHLLDYRVRRHRVEVASAIAVPHTQVHADCTSSGGLSRAIGRSYFLIMLRRLKGLGRS